jgi:membrane-bound lytic murein transglycosylase D
LRLPKDKIALFTSNEDKIYAYVQHELDGDEKPYERSSAVASRTDDNSTTRTRTKYYKVRRGDNLGSIADKYDVSVSDLKRWNGLRSNRIAYGKSLKIVSTETIAVVTKKQSDADSTNKQRLATATISKEEATDTTKTIAGTVYTVSSGDNMIAIAEKNNISVEDIKQWNNLSSTALQIGQELVVAQIVIEDKEAIPALTIAEEPVALTNIKYTVAKGDNLTSISKKFGTAVNDLKSWNRLTSPAVAIGSTLIVAKDEPAILTDNASASSFMKKQLYGKATASKSGDYYVQKGDSLYSISKKYPGVTVSDLKKWNDITTGEIKPGMKLKISG